MARRRASMREGPLAELFRATEAAQRQAEKEGREPQAELTESEQQAAAAPPAEAPAPPAEPKPTPVEPPEQTVEHVPEWEEAAPPPPPPPPPSEPVRLPERPPEPKREEPPRTSSAGMVTRLAALTSARSTSSDPAPIRRLPSRKRGSQCQRQRPSSCRRRFFFSPSFDAGRDRCGR